MLYTKDLTLPQRTRFMNSTGAGDMAFIADLMTVLTLVQQSLESGSPLPAILPTPLVGKAMMRGGAHRQKDDLKLTEHLAEKSGRQHISAVSALMRLLGAVDNLVLVLKKAVGESSAVDMAAFEMD
jgi:hypothetical protein